MSTGGRRRLTAEARREVVERAAAEVFAERGYRGASVDEIARRSGVSVPVVYDHVESKQALYRRLIEQHYAELRAIWFEHAATAAPLGEWLAGAVDRWFAYVEEHPFAARRLFHDTTGDPELSAMHRQIQAESRAAMLPLVEAAGEGLDWSDPLALELAWEPMRAVLQGLALWWSSEHPELPRARIVDAAMDALWLGFDRVLTGASWRDARRSEGGATDR